MGSRLRSTEASEAWRALLTTFSDLNRVLAAEMEAETGLPIEYYEILLMLFETETGSMRPSEIAENRRLSRSGATRLIDRLEGHGLVRRRTCGSDRRASLVELTSQGEAVFTSAGRVHLQGIDRHVGSHLTSTDMAELRRILAKLDPGRRP